MAKYRILTVISAALMLSSCGGNTEQVMSETAASEITSGTLTESAETTSAETTAEETTTAETSAVAEETDGIRKLEIPLDDVRQYFTEEGRALIEEIPSAKTKSASLIEYKGQTFTTLERHIPYDLFGDNNYLENGAYTEGDYIVMESMPKIGYVYIGGGTDLKRIAALRILRWVGIISEISDITPLYDTGFIIYDWSKYLTEEQCEEYTARGGIVNR